MTPERIAGTIVETTIAGKAIRFFVTNPADFIQRHHLAGEFYESQELALMSRYMTPETRYLDIGTNVGNHVIFLSKFIGLKNIVVVEPNGTAMAILRINLLLNEMLDAVDGSCLGVGLSDEPGRADMVQSMADNLGGAHFVEAPDGPFHLTTGDMLLGERTFDFIKIDVEGMEVMCLKGMERLIARCRPMLFVEVDNLNQDAFLEWCAAHRYGVKERFRRYPHNENYLVASLDSART
jgi:FkbM family methyltransferase